MNRVKRLLTALIIILSGIVLVPYVSLPAEAFSWERFADAYEPTPTLTINHDVGQPGSFFEIKGEDFPPDDIATITINGVTLSTIPTDSDGKFEFELNTAGAEVGAYFVTATVNGSGATVKFVLDANASDTWPSEGALVVFSVPSNIAFTEVLYLPLILNR